MHWSLAALGAVTLGAIGFFATQEADSGCSIDHHVGAQLSQLAAAIEFYHLDTGQYPTTEQGLSSLVVRPTIEPVPSNYPASGYVKKRDMLVDPWGERYRYFSDGHSFVVLSSGGSSCECHYATRPNKPLQRTC